MTDPKAPDVPADVMDWTEKTELHPLAMHPSIYIVNGEDVVAQFPDEKMRAFFLHAAQTLPTVIAERDEANEMYDEAFSACAAAIKERDALKAENLTLRNAAVALDEKCDAFQSRMEKLESSVINLRSLVRAFTGPDDAIACAALDEADRALLAPTGETT